MSAEEKDAIDEPAAPTEREGAERAEFQEQTRAHRLEKLAKLRERGIEPYPVRFDRDATAAALREEFAELAAGTDTGKRVRDRRPGAWASAATAASTSPTSRTRPGRSS